MSAAARRIADWLGAGSSCWLYTTDPGGHACLAVVADALEARGAPYRWIAEGWSRERGVVESAAFEDIEDGAGARVLVGTQLDFARTRAVIRALRARDVASMYLFDAWAHYTRPFVDPDGAVSLPDVIGVPCPAAAQAVIEGLAAHGVDAADRVEVVGHPDIERVADTVRAVPAETVRAVREELDVDPGPLWLFLTEPIEADWGRDEAGRPPLGLTELTILETFLRDHVPADATVLVRPHPRQDRAALAAWLGAHAAGRRVALSEGRPLAVDLAAADAVFGMFTSALLAAERAGRPTRSLQWGRTAHGRTFSNPHLETMMLPQEETP